MFVTNWISTTKIQKISEITNFFRHYFLSRTEVYYSETSKILYVYLEVLIKKLPNAFDSLAAFLIFVSSCNILSLDRTQELNHCITIALRCFVEVHG